MIRRGDSRGLSTIVATLLIILLTLVAVGIVWVVIRNVINQSAEQVSLGKFTLNLEIKNVGIDPATPSNVNVRIKRNPGEGTISGLNFIIDDGDNTEVVKLVNFSLNELEERTINLSLKSITNSSLIKTVAVAPIFRLESGKDVTGDVKDEYEMPKTYVNTCVPNCANKNCGSNGCGGSCGSCTTGFSCNANGTCLSTACTPNCVGKNCGSDGCTGTCGTCTSPQTCNATGICVTTCTDTCNTFNYNCEYHTICGSNISCGTCSGGQTCNITGRCVTGCTAESNTTFCTRLGKNCGSLTGTDNCGNSRTVTSCGTCTSPQTCNATGICATGCTAESNTTFCTRLGKNCGSLTGTDNCGNSRTVTSCGTCTSPQTCNATGICATSAFTWTGELTRNGGFEWNNLTGWTEDNGDYGNGFEAGTHMGNAEYVNPQSGTYQAWANGASDVSSGPDFYLYQDVNLTAYTSYINLGNAIINASGWGATSEKTGGADTTRIQFIFLGSSHNVLSTALDSGWIYWVNGTWWQRQVNNYPIPQNARYLRISASSYETCGSSYCDSGSWDTFSVKVGYR